MSRDPWNDDEFESGYLTKVNGPSATGWYDVTSSTGWSCGIDGQYGVVPKIGDEFTTWGRMGFPIRGQALNGRVLYYRTQAEQDVADQQEAERVKAGRIAAYESKRAQHDARVAALPAPLRERVEGFRAHGGDAWRWEFEPYEMACCEEAARLAARFKTGDAIKAFSALGYDAQKAAHPTMDAGHSGNTWGMSIRLAWLVVEKPELVAKEHAALCCLTGCGQARCYASRKGGA